MSKVTAAFLLFVALFALVTFPRWQNPFASRTEIERAQAQTELVRAQEALARVEVAKIHEQNMSEIRLLQQAQTIENAAMMRTILQGGALLFVIALAIAGFAGAVLLAIYLYARYMEMVTRKIGGRP